MLTHKIVLLNIAPNIINMYPQNRASQSCSQGRGRNDGQGQERGRQRSGGPDSWGGPRPDAVQIAEFYLGQPGLGELCGNGRRVACDESAAGEWASSGCVERRKREDGERTPERTERGTRKADEPHSLFQGSRVRNPAWASGL